MAPAWQAALPLSLPSAPRTCSSSPGRRTRGLEALADTQGIPAVESHESPPTSPQHRANPRPGLHTGPPATMPSPEKASAQARVVWARHPPPAQPEKDIRAAALLQPQVPREGPPCESWAAGPASTCTHSPPPRRGLAGRRVPRSGEGAGHPLCLEPRSLPSLGSSLSSASG